MANTSFEEALPLAGRSSASAEETRAIGREAGRALAGPVFISLEGPMGAGKTTFVSGLAEGLGCEAREVSSPTFTLVHEHGGGRWPLVHMDWHRLEQAGDLEALGFDDYLRGGAVLAVEWGGRFPEALPARAVRLEFSIDGGARTVRRLA
jgi:tRNA threonylcarbamoyladenosine biosynthesis protein TsaE